MFILQSIFSSFIFIVHSIAMILMLVVIAYAVLTWLLSPYHPFVQTLGQAADPILRPFRRWPLRIGSIDFTPLIVIVLIQLAETILVYLIQLGARSLGA